jgi:hypothetical protein
MPTVAAHRAVATLRLQSRMVATGRYAARKQPRFGSGLAWLAGSAESLKNDLSSRQEYRSKRTTAGPLLHRHDRTASGAETLMADVPLLSRAANIRIEVATCSLAAALEFAHGRGQRVATLVQWPFDCSDLHSVWEPSSPS